MPLKLLNWNVEWAAAKWKAAELQRRIAQHAADIVCLTETDTARLALTGGYSICAQDNWGQPFRKGQEGQAEGPAVVQSALGGRGCCWPRIAPARAIRGRRHPNQRRRGNGDRRLHSLLRLASGYPLGPEDVAGPRGVSGWPGRIAETGSQNAPRRGGRFQPADRATQCNAAPPPRSPPVHPRAEPVDRHRGPGLSGAENHRPHRVEPRPRRRLPRRHQQRPSGRESVGPFRRCCRPFRSGYVTEDPGQERMAIAGSATNTTKPTACSGHPGYNRISVAPWVR